MGFFLQTDSFLATESFENVGMRGGGGGGTGGREQADTPKGCLLYTSDAADE